jgi:methyl-accepting chemotaxis protein
MRFDIVKGGAPRSRPAPPRSDVPRKQALKGSQDIASAAEEQSSAAEEAAKTVEEQAQALAQSEQTAQNLSEIAEELKNSTDVAKSAEEVASAAEELSVRRAGNQPLRHPDHGRASNRSARDREVQAAAAEESSAAITQIEKGVELAQQRATAGGEKVLAIKSLLA